MANPKVKETNMADKPPVTGVFYDSPQPIYVKQELPWQPGPASGGGLPPESATEVLIDRYGKREVVVLYEKDWITNMAFTIHSAFYGTRLQWKQVRRWLIIK